ncbi:MAG: hypothetical protein H6Q89_5099 [Myxococcaceae bacterium]|nr:hypothetical protein [Myxococcaceae bacterium]
MTPRHDIKTVRAQALELHKRLIDQARVRYEVAHGRVGPGEMLRIVTFDPDFAWLRPLTQAILAIDDRLDLPELTHADAAAVRLQLEQALGHADASPKTVIARA